MRNKICNGVKITIRNLHPSSARRGWVSISAKKIKQALLKTLSLQRRKKNGEVVVCIAGDKLIREMNLFYRGSYVSTDVLSFDGSDRKGALRADIIICIDAALKNYKTFHTTPGYELCLYAVHGLLHILGDDDATMAKGRKMQKKAERILSSAGLFKP